MPRKGGVVKRPVPQDLKYNDVLVSRFINGLMERGKKSTAQRILYNAMEMLGERGNDDPLKLFHQAVESFGVDIQLSLTGNKFGQVQGETECVVKLECCFTAYN